MSVSSLWGAKCQTFFNTVAFNDESVTDIDLFSISLIFYKLFSTNLDDKGSMTPVLTNISRDFSVNI